MKFQSASKHLSIKSCLSSLRYSLNIPAGAVIKAPSTATTFRTTEDANLKFSSSFDPMTISTFESDGGVPNETVSSTVVSMGEHLFEQLSLRKDKRRGQDVRPIRTGIH